jgi:hypothetical protein
MQYLAVIGNVKSDLHGTYHDLSDKHWPRYLAEFCDRFHRRFQTHTMVDRLVYVVCGFNLFSAPFEIG